MRCTLGRRIIVQSVLKARGRRTGGGGETGWGARDTLRGPRSRIRSRAGWRRPRGGLEARTRTHTHSHAQKADTNPASNHRSGAGLLVVVFIQLTINTDCEFVLGNKDRGRLSNSTASSSGWCHKLGSSRTCETAVATSRHSPTHRANIFFRVLASSPNVLRYTRRPCCERPALIHNSPKQCAVAFFSWIFFSS